MYIYSDLMVSGSRWDGVRLSSLGQEKKSSKNLRFPGDMGPFLSLTLAAALVSPVVKPPCDEDCLHESLVPWKTKVFEGILFDNLPSQY